MAGGVVSAAYIGTVADLGPERVGCQQDYDQVYREISRSKETSLPIIRSVKSQSGKGVLSIRLTYPEA